MKSKSLEYFFAKKQLLNILSKKRAVLAKKEHDKLFHKSLLDQRRSNSFNIFLYEIFPPRNEWLRLKKMERKGRNAVEVNARQIERTVLRLTNNFKGTPKSDWERKLDNFLNDIQSKALGNGYIIPKPQIISHFKEEKDGKKIYRPIAHFEYIDRVIISQVNKYLTNCFDPLFLDCSYAFRSKEVLAKSFSHHNAVEDILEYKAKFKKTDLWVAEYDIKKFFDCVNHKIIDAEFNNKVKDAENNGTQISKRAIELFNSYLNSYSFNFSVRTIALGKDKEFGWVNEAELEKVGSDCNVEKIGVPQGGALSCLIANILMDVVDREVKKHDDGNLFYARFCDDMVLIHPQKNTCQNALDSYSKALGLVKLIGHNPSEIKDYSKEFWNSKSKAPYKWADNPIAQGDKKNVPWLSFVGYQISSNLKVRVRKSSIRNEILKQSKETDKVITLIKKGKKFRVSERAIRHRLRQRLLAMSVGRKNIFDMQKPGKMCWTSGFRVLKKNDFIKFQLRNLDRKRNAQLSRLTNHISKMDKSKRPEKNSKIKEFDKEPKYYGSPFSYYYQIK
jgi:hypothetical protein